LHSDEEDCRDQNYPDVLVVILNGYLLLEHMLLMLCILIELLSILKCLLTAWVWHMPLLPTMWLSTTSISATSYISLSASAAGTLLLVDLTLIHLLQMQLILLKLPELKQLSLNLFIRHRRLIGWVKRSIQQCWILTLLHITLGCHFN
jgi:hypothetical protein